MRKTTGVFAIAFLLVVAILPLCLNIGIAKAQSNDFSIQRVDHQVEVLYSGHVIIQDTIHVSGQITEGFWIGFPNKYGSYVLKGMAYAANDSLPISLGAPFEGQGSSYGASISYPNGSPQVFTVIFVLK